MAMQERKALGKGLSSLIPIGIKSDPASKVYLECPMEDIVPGQNQPRKLFAKTSIDELADSIEAKGVLQPLIVRRIGGGKYELIAGERRLRACRKINMEKIPVVVKEVEQHETLELALIENIQREDLNPIEEALAYKELLGKYQYTQDELAKRIGRDRSSIANILRLLKLHENIRGSIISGQISMGHARAILAIEDRELQQKIVNEIIKNDLSVREVESWIRRLNEETENVEEEKKSSVKSPAEKNKRFKNIEDEMKKVLKTKVEVKSSGKKGKIVVHFHSEDELNRLVDLFSGSS